MEERAGAVTSGPGTDQRVELVGIGRQPRVLATALLAFARAIEQCNGQGACRKLDGGMCPSYMATHDEEHSTRGRANLLRMAISGVLPPEELTGERIASALDLCVECKACKVECPSGVDLAKLMEAGQVAEASLPLQPLQQVAAVPSTAVLYDEGRAYLFRVNSDTLELVEVRLGPRVGELQVVEQGIKAADRIVTRDVAALSHGQKVQPVTAGDTPVAAVER